MARAEKRVALVIGNSSYRNIAPLDNPQKDARLMADTLRSIGFELIGGAAQIDLDKGQFDRVVQSFSRQLPGADVSLFYYAGHGVQVRSSNYLVPIDASPVREADVDFQMVDVALVLHQMEGAGTRLNLVILDACRNNPFGDRALRGGARGLAQMVAPEGTLISYATQPGNVALDGDSGHSPYTAALAATVQKPGLDLFQTFNEVGLLVKHSTAGSQQPWVSSSPIAGTFYFSGPAKTNEVSPQVSTSSEAERAWNSIRDTQNTALLEDFVQHFGGSFYGSLARARIDELRAKKLAAAPTSQPEAPIAIPPSMLGTKPRLLGQFGSWGAYTANAEGKKLCFAITGYSPSGSKTDNNKTYVFISARPGLNVANEFSVTLSYQVKEGAPGASAEIGGESYDLWGQGNGLWIKNVLDEDRMIARMRASPELALKGLGTGETRFRIPLKGFAEAVDRMGAECR
jgi:Caspase domain